jgi:hypothetical protein
MKLELKHLAAYLPFGLKIMYFGKQRKMNAGNGSSKNWIGITATIQRQGENCKPILRPLSDLTKEIEVGGERFVPIKEFMILYGGCTTEKGKPIFESDFITNIMYSYYGSLSYGVIEKLFEWHFDVFGLIEQGLAININTL